MVGTEFVTADSESNLIRGGKTMRTGSFVENAIPLCVRLSENVEQLGAPDVTRRMRGNVVCERDGCEVAVRASARVRRNV